MPKRQLKNRMAKTVVQPNSKFKLPRNSSHGTASYSSSTNNYLQKMAHYFKKAFYYMFTFFLALVSLLVFWPRVTVEVGAATVPQNLLTSPFTITNTGLTPLRDLKVGLSVCQISVGLSPYPPATCNYERESILMFGPWARSWLSTDEKYTISPNELLAADKSNVTRADFGIWLAYRPWYIPWELTKTYRVKAALGADGVSRLVAQPLSR